jgi:hypothetical protein
MWQEARRIVTEPSLTAFLLCNEGPTRDYREFVLCAVREKGFDVLLELVFGAADRPAVAEWLRATDAPVPAERLHGVLFAHDLIPLQLAPDQLEQDPACDNARTFAVRAAMETELARRCLAPADRGLIASSNSSEAWALLRSLAGERESGLRQLIAEREQAFAPAPAIRDLSGFACRARVQLVDWQGSPAVRKTFRHTAERFLQRELDVFEQLGPVTAAIPKLFEHGADYFVMEFVEPDDRLHRSAGLLPLRQVRELADFVRLCLKHGFNPVDLKPGGNTIFTRRGLRVVDYEFWRRCDPATPPEACLCIAGLPADDDGDRPWGLKFPFEPYASKWIERTGLDAKSLFHDPVALQHAKRFVWRIRVVARSLVRWAALPMQERAHASGQPPMRLEQPD